MARSGQGKPPTAGELTTRIRDSRIFDAEKVGGCCGTYWASRRGTSRTSRPGAAWSWRPPVRSWTTSAARWSSRRRSWSSKYWQEIRAGLAKAGIPVHHFLLHTDQDTLVHRIANDTEPASVAGRQWRLDHLPRYQQAVPWLYREAEVIDTTELTPDLVAEVVASRVWPHGDGLYR